MIRNHRIGYALVAVLFTLGDGMDSSAELRSEFCNRSSQEWRLTLVEGLRSGVGALRVIEKFTGRQIANLDKAGASVKLPPGARYLVEFTREDHYFFHDFILQDSHGQYVEYTATVPYRSSPTPVLSVQESHVGAPLDRATDEAIRTAIDDAINTENGNLIIIHDLK